MSNKKIKIANKSDIPEGKTLVVYYGKDDEEEIALFNQGGEIYALNNLCPHMEGPLGEGPVDNGTVSCPWHGWQFDIKTGNCINMPGHDAKKINISVKGDAIYLVLDESIDSLSES